MRQGAVAQSLLKLQHGLQWEYLERTLSFVSNLQRDSKETRFLVNCLAGADVLPQVIALQATEVNTCDAALTGCEAGLSVSCAMRALLAHLEEEVVLRFVNCDPSTRSLAHKWVSTNNLSSRKAQGFSGGFAH